jgi:hypothetical protein
MSIDQVRKWAHGNDIWALAVVETMSEPVHAKQQEAVTQLLDKYQDIFQEPKHLPPHRYIKTSFKNPSICPHMDSMTIIFHLSLVLLL